MRIEFVQLLILTLNTAAAAVATVSATVAPIIYNVSIMLSNR